jgi:hypothetical protein
MIDDETLDRQLREAVPYINDDGFTARVIARLPTVRREPHWLRALFVLAASWSARSLLSSLFARLPKSAI